MEEIMIKVTIQPD